MTIFAQEVVRINPNVMFAKVDDIALTAKYTHFDVPQDEVVKMDTRRFKIAMGIVAFGLVPASFIWLFGANTLLGWLLFSIGLLCGMTYESIMRSRQQSRTRWVTYEDYLNLVPSDVRQQIKELQKKFPDLWVNAVGYGKRKKVEGIAYIRIYHGDEVVMFYLHPDLYEGS